MVKEIIDGFDTLLKPFKEARHLRDELAGQVGHKQLNTNWQTAIFLHADREAQKLKDDVKFQIRK